MEKLRIVKIGGTILEEEALLDRVLTSFARLNGPKLLVHGGGRAATKLGKRLGIEAQLIDGRRLTDAATLELVTMVYAGLLNKRLVTRLQALGCDALGCSGADANLIRAEKRRVGKIDYGFVGDVVAVRGDLLADWLERGISPVFCAITHDGAGQLLNSNADGIATSLVKKMVDHYRVEFYICFEKTGVLDDPKDDNSWLEKLSPDEYAAGRANGRILAGMIPKLDYGFAAKTAGAERVLIGGPAGLQTNQGTELWT